MNKTLRVEIEIETDKGDVNNMLDRVRTKLIEINEMEGIGLVTTWEYHKGRGNWLTYGWGYGKTVGKTQIWVPLRQQ